MSKYFNISQEIISTIRKGQLSPGMKVPSENDIIKKYNVSNTTARKVLSELENSGYAIRVKGKGTYVKTKEVDRTVTRILGFSKNMLEAGFTPNTKLLKSEILESGYTSTINGRFYIIKGPVLKIERLRYADDIPMMFEKRYISMQLCPGIENKDLRKSLYDIYENVYGHILKEVNQMLNAIVLNEKQLLKLFTLKENSPAFLVNGVTFCAKETILEIEESIYRGDKYHFSVKAT